MSAAVISAAEEPMVTAAREAARVGRELVPRAAAVARLVADDLVASLAVMEHCALEASWCRGRVRRKLADIARGKAARSGAALDILVDLYDFGDADVAPVRDALEEAMGALAPPRRTPLSELLRR